MTEPVMQVAAVPFVWNVFLKKRPANEHFFGDFEPLTASSTLHAASTQLPPQLLCHQPADEPMATAQPHAARSHIKIKDRAAEVEAGVRQAVRGVLGTDISSQAPLVQSGLDSLGNVLRMPKLLLPRGAPWVHQETASNVR